MNSSRIRIASPDQIPVDWGTPREAIRQGTVITREPQALETFATTWGTLTAVPGQDLVIIQEDGEQYPIKKAVFSTTYEQITPGRYRKKARSRLVQVPPGVVAVLVTREGELEVRHPDYVVIGADNEVYANAVGWVTQHLIWTDSLEV